VITRYQMTAERIRQELSALERVAARAKRSITLARERDADQDLYLDSAALSLHNFYTGLERAFHQIAAMVDEQVPTGPGWHRELLDQMSRERPQVRPAIISEETRESLDEYLRFRHVVRSIYAFEFDPDRLERLVEGLDSVFQRTRRELHAFADFLEKLAKADEEEGEENDDEN